MIRRFIDWIKKQIWLHKKTSFKVYLANEGALEAELNARLASNQALNKNDVEF